MKRTCVALLVLGIVGVFAFGQTEISFWHSMTGAHEAVLTAIVDQFNEQNEDIVVDLVYQGHYGALETKLFASVAAGRPPTIAMQYENVTVQFLPALAAMEDYMDPNVIANLTPEMAASNTFDGSLTTIPFNKSIFMFMYRADLIEAPPTTWQEYYDLVADLTEFDDEGDVVFYGTGLRPFNPEIFLTFLEQAGGRLLNEDMTEVLVNDEKGLLAAEFIASLLPYTLVQGGFLSGPMGEGIIGGYYNSSAGLPFDRSAAEAAGGELGVARVPAGPENARAMIQGTNLGVFRLGHTEEEIVAAARFLEFLISDEPIVTWAIETGYLPVTQSALASAAWQNHIADHPAQAEMTDSFLDGFNQIHHPNYSAMRDALIVFFEDLLYGEDPQTALDALAQELEDLL